MTSILRAVQRLFDSAVFPAFAVTGLVLWEALLVLLLVAPAASPELEAFAEEFRVWCFGVDPGTGRAEWALVVAMMSPPILIAGGIAVLWYQPLRDAMRRPRELVAPVSLASLFVLGAAAGLVALGSPADTTPLPFPAEALRTSHRPPDLRLTNQDGEQVDLADLRGDVVLLTAIYTHCAHTCPLLLGQTKGAVAELSDAERADLRVVAVTLDPERDTPERLAQLATAHGVEAPAFQLVTGASDEVNEVLDQMEVARKRDPETGIIDHSNLFLVLDRDGRVAYRLGLGERQERWLVSALRVLLAEGAQLAG